MYQFWHTLLFFLHFFISRNAHNTLILNVLSQISCICLCKDTNFKANHNPLGEVISGGAVVYAYAKILILKQITTEIRLKVKRVSLYMPMQRY